MGTESAPQYVNLIVHKLETDFLKTQQLRPEYHSRYNRCMRLMGLITAPVLCARSQNLAMSASVHRVDVVFLNAGFKGGGKPCRNT